MNYTPGRANIVKNKRFQFPPPPPPKKLFEVNCYRLYRAILTEKIFKRRHSNSLWVRSLVPGRGSENSPHVC